MDDRAARLIIPLIVNMIYILFITNFCLSKPSGGIPKNYDFSQNRTVGIYIKPSGHDTLDRTYTSVISLQFMSLGYKVVDINSLVKQGNEKIPDRKGIDDIAELLLHRKDISTMNAIALVAPAWDSAFIVTDIAHRQTVYGVEQRYSGWKVPKLSAEMTIVDIPTKEKYLNFDGQDTCRLYASQEGSIPAYEEYPWIIIARQVTKALKNIPVCVAEDTSSATYHIPIIFYVDESYRQRFPQEWKLRLQRRLLYASDIFRKQFDIQFDLVGFAAWPARFSSSMGFELTHLWESTEENARALRVGITVDPQLKRIWSYRSTLGMAFVTGTHAVVSAQPSFPEATEWNSIEEALTLVHEIGHLLGAGHSSIETSIMYPFSGSLSFEFDQLNKYIIDSMKQHFFDLSEETRLQQCIGLLINARSTPLKNSINVISQIAREVQHLQSLTLRQSHKIADSILMTSLMTKEIADSSLRYAVEGYIDYKQDHLDNAVQEFNKALELEPDFAEVHSYLSNVFHRLGKSEESEKQKKIAEQYHMSLLDE